MSSHIAIYFLRSRLVRVAVLVILLIIGIGIIRSVYSLSQKRGIVTQRQQVLSRLIAKNKQLQEELKEATSPAFVEQQARDKLGLVREGETVVIMDKSQNSELRPQENLKELPSWKQWWRLFF